MKQGSRLFYTYLVFIVIYSGFILIPAPLPATLVQYDVSATGLRIISITIILLLAAIWFAGFYGYSKLRTYSRLIQGNKDGVEVNKLAKGMFLLVMWLPVSSVVSVVLNYFALRHITWLPTVTIINNYINLLIPFVGFIFIGMGANGLISLVKQKQLYWVINVVIVFITYIGLIYTQLVADIHDLDDVYHMPLWLIMLTIVAPYIYMWSIGLVAAYQINLYRQKVAGVVYRKSWGLTALGLCWLIVMSVIFQYLITLTPRLNDLSIYWLLAIVYSLLLVLSVGFILVALGARKLQKIEEV